VVLDEASRPLFNELLLGRRRPTTWPFDLLIADGIDLRQFPPRAQTEESEMREMTGGCLCGLVRYFGECAQAAILQADETQFGYRGERAQAAAQWFEAGGHCWRRER
jgi:hypothetical protein